MFNVKLKALNAYEEMSCFYNITFLYCSYPAVYTKNPLMKVQQGFRVLPF